MPAAEPAALGGRADPAETLIHHQDIRRAGRQPRAIPAERGALRNLGPKGTGGAGAVQGCGCHRLCCHRRERPDGADIDLAQDVGVFT